MKVPPRPGAGYGDAAATRDPAIRWLLWWYPRGWRARYGEELAELLAAEHAECGPSVRRNVNVMAAGLRARLAGAGLAGHRLEAEAARQAGLAVITACVAAVVLAGTAMWSQLAIGLQWSVPHDHGIPQAMDLMSVALLMLAALIVLAAAPVAWSGVAAAMRGRGRQVRWPVACMTTGLVTLVVGSRHFENNWPGTGGHLLAHQGLVPGGIAAFAWASTMWISSYWAHPAALAAFGAAQLVWMLLSPVATGFVITGALRLLRRVRLSPRAFRYQACVAALAWTGLAALLGGALRCLTSEHSGLFHVGAIDRAMFTVLAAAVLVGALAVRGALAAAWSGPGRAVMTPPR